MDWKKMSNIKEKFCLGKKEVGNRLLALSFLRLPWHSLTLSHTHSFDMFLCALRHTHARTRASHSSPVSPHLKPRESFSVAVAATTNAHLCQRISRAVVTRCSSRAHLWPPNRGMTSVCHSPIPTSMPVFPPRPGSSHAGTIDAGCGEWGRRRKRSRQLGKDPRALGVPRFKTNLPFPPPPSPHPRIWSQENHATQC